MPKEWEVLSSEIVYKKKWMQVIEAACKLPNGSILSPYIIVDVPSFCNVFIVTDNDEIVFVKQYRHAAGIVSIELPGGMVDDGEDPRKTAIREMREETGYASTEIELLYSVHPNPPLENNTAWFYLAKNAKQVHAIELDPFEDIELVLYTKQAFMKLLLNPAFSHGVQAGAMYAAAIKLGWLVPQ